MFRSSLVAFVLLVAGCSSAKVIREGKGWREVEAKDSGTVIEMMTDDPAVLADLAKSAPDARVRAEGSVRELLGRFDVAFGRKVEDDGDLTFQGRRTRCRWVRYNFQRGGDVAQVRRWLRDEVPGGVARIDLEVSPEGQPLTHLTALAT